MSPPTSGIICSPDCWVDPFTICRYCGTIAMPPNIPMPVMTAMTVVSGKRRCGTVDRQQRVVP